MKIRLAASASLSSTPGSTMPWDRAFSRMRGRFRPAPSSRNSTDTSLPSWCRSTVMVPDAGLPAAVRTSGSSMPWATQLRSKCSKAGVMRSSTPRSISMEPPVMSSLICLPVSLEAWRTTAYRRSAMPSNSTMRVRSRSRCSSRAWRPWAIRSSSAPSMARCRLRCTVATSLTDSAIMRVNSCTRVKRSNSSGSKPAAESLDSARRDCICDSACTSMSRNCWRKRSRLPDRSVSELRNWPRRASRRERLIITSPA